MWRLIQRLSTSLLTRVPPSQCLLETKEIHTASHHVRTGVLSRLDRAQVDNEQRKWAAISVLSVRGSRKQVYQPSAWKRINKHGIHQKLYSESGIHVLWRRVLKGRHNLAPFERLLKGAKKGRILP